MSAVASAPGKVLITGGYLVLERPNAGIVLSTTARFYAIVKPIYEEVLPESWAWSWGDVKLASPQLSREASYKISLKNSTLQCISSRDSPNPFVEQAIQYAVAAATAICVDKDQKDALMKLLLQGLDITILGSNDFYSYRNQIEAQGLPLDPETLAMLPQFSLISFNTEAAHGENHGDKCKPEVAKTGLGSSAAMTTSVVAALLHYLRVVRLPSDKEDRMTSNNLDLVHTIAQTAHCIAQGKVGSGFDVSAAVYGSQRYVRFSPSLLSAAQVTAKVPSVISEIINEKWDHEKAPFSLPPLMTLLLGEPGSGGSSTPSMVGAVKQWQKADPQGSLETWTGLGVANSQLERQLGLLSKFASEDWKQYLHIILHCGSHKHSKWTELAGNNFEHGIVRSVLEARQAFLQIRSHMQKMGKAAGVPIEPESQTQLLDFTMDMEGVLLAGVPGAGGFDAIFAITLGKDSADAVQKKWTSLGVLPLLVREDPRGVVLEDGDPRAGQVTSRISSMQIA